MISSLMASGTDSPRELTDLERAAVCQGSRLQAAQLHRSLTGSTLRAAVLCIDEIRFDAACAALPRVFP